MTKKPPFENIRPAPAPLGSDEKTPPRGHHRFPVIDYPQFRPRQGETTLDHLLARLDAINEALSSPYGRLASIDDRIDSLLCGLRSLASVVMSMEELQSPMVPSSHELKDRHVLIVEDELLVQRSFARVIAGADGTSIIAGTAQHAIEILKSDGARVHVALIDLRLGPGINGLALCRLLQSDYPWIGIVILTGMLTDNEEKAAREMAIPVLVKPCHNSDLIQAIKEAYARRAAAAAGRE